MRSKLLPAETVRKKSLECAVNITKKKKQRELNLSIIVLSIISPLIIVNWQVINNGKDTCYVGSL